MVIGPVLRGMLGLESDAIHHSLVFSPHVPANWTHFSVENVRLGENTLTLNYSRTEKGVLSLEADRTAGSNDCIIEFRPAVSARARVQRAELNGQPLPFRIEPHDADQHVVVRIPLTNTKNSLKIFLVNDFSISVDSTLPQLGSSSQGLRIISQTWSPSKDQLTLELREKPGAEYQLRMSNPEQIDRLDALGWSDILGHWRNGVVTIRAPKRDSEEYQHAKLVIIFKSPRSESRNLQ
jgi:hypothetical protein